MLDIWKDIIAEILDDEDVEATTAQINSIAKKVYDNIGIVSGDEGVVPMSVAVEDNRDKEIAKLENYIRLLAGHFNFYPSVDTGEIEVPEYIGTAHVSLVKKKL